MYSIWKFGLFLTGLSLPLSITFESRCILVATAYQWLYFYENLLEISFALRGFCCFATVKKVAGSLIYAKMHRTCHWLIFCACLAPCRIFHAVSVTFAYYSTKRNYLKENHTFASSQILCLKNYRINTLSPIQLSIYMQCCGSTLVSMRIGSSFLSQDGSGSQIRIQVAKPIKKLNFYFKKYT